MKKFALLFLTLLNALFGAAQINTEQVMNVGRNALYFEDYILSIQYFNQVIAAKPYLAQPYFLRALAKYNLDDLKGAEADVSDAIERNPFITDAYELRGVIRQNQGKLAEAVEDYNRALNILPENRSLLFNKSMALVDLKDYKNARTTLNFLITKYPRFDNGFLGRAQLNLLEGDTIAASADIESALKVNKNATNAYVLRSEINMKHGADSFPAALKDMEEAVRLNPKNAGFFINRAFLRYKLDDYFGAMSDYDYAIQLEPENFVAHYNRALLCTEVRDYDKALSDFNEVIRLKPDEYRTLFNRSMVYRDRHEYKKALADISKVIEAFPTLAAAYFIRYDIKQSLHDRSAQRDLDKSLALAKERIRVKGEEGAADTSDLFGTPDVEDEVGSTDNSETESQETVAARFSSMLTVRDNISVDQEYNNKSIRGKIQDRNVTIEIEPLFALTYFISPTDLKPSSDYTKELDEINRTRALRFVLQLTNHELSIDNPEEIDKHFKSIEYYNSYIATHPPRAIDFFGRAMDEYTVHNYEAALADLNRSIDLTPDFTLAYFLRALTNNKMARLKEVAPADAKMADAMNDLRKKRLSSVIDDLDKSISLSPTMAVAHYNKGTVLLEGGDYTSAINSLSRAIELSPELGEAYYNRGYAYLMLGNKLAGMSDLSKAGELGVVPSYNLLKRMGQK